MKATDVIWVIAAQYVSGYKISITFNDGLKKVIDLQPYLKGQIFEPLKDINNFKRFRVTDWSIEWDNGADMAPEFLYELNN